MRPHWPQRDPFLQTRNRLRAHLPAMQKRSPPGLQGKGQSAGKTHARYSI